MPTLDWIGKDKVINHHLDVPFRVLDKQYSYPVGANSPNKIIHGDNLEALKALLPEYEGKVKCIYIDPPYNTGNEGWVYNDNVNDPKIVKWLGDVVGKEGEDLTRHDKWLCMMYPRLKLLQRLLANDGFIFISIDVFEFARLKLLADEIFGSSNFRNCIAIRRGIKNVQAQFDDIQALSLGHEYIFMYSKTPSSRLPKLALSHESDKPGKWDTFWRGTDRPTMRFEIFGITPKSGQWRWESVRAKRAAENYETYLRDYSEQMTIDEYYIDHLASTNEKLDFIRLEESNVVRYYVPPQSGKLLSDNWMDILLSGSFAGFDTEKNVLILERIVQWITNGNDIILDSFAGSGTTAHAVLNANKQDGGNRQFILIEMEDYAETITAERVRRVIDGYGNTAGTGGNFEYYELGEPLLIDNQYLNEAVPDEVIRSYIWYMETRKPLLNDNTADNDYLLGKSNDTAYYFYYKKNALTTLDAAFLATLQVKAEGYVIYADQCAISDAELKRFGIVFKKIPRDITKL
jgi:DNA modification methylase